MDGITILPGDCIASMRGLPDQSVHTCITSPPYFGLRSYLPADHPDKGLELGNEPTPTEFVAALVEVFREVRRLLRDDGTLWLNLGDSYSGAKPGAPGRGLEADGWNRAITDARRRAPPTPGVERKNLIGIPWRVAFALQDDGWYLRQDIIWHKPNPMPESVKDRCTKAHEYLFLLTKTARYAFNQDAMKEPASGKPPGNKMPTKSGRQYEEGAAEHRTSANLHAIGARETRNRRSVWTIATRPYAGAHFATFPADLIEPCILAGAPLGGTVLDPFGGSGTTGGVALKHGRRAILCELNPDSIALMPDRILSIAGETGNLFARAAE